MKNPTSAYERRLQDLESAIDQMGRVGVVSDVKYENGRWYARMKDVLNTTYQKPSSAGTTPNFYSDWIPWQSFSHATIKFSIPPRVGQKCFMKSPYGVPQMAHLEHYSYDEDNQSPSQNPDEFVLQVSAPPSSSSDSTTTQQSVPLRIVGNKDGCTVTIGKTTLKLTGDTCHVDTTHHTVTTTQEASVVAQSEVTVKNGANAKIHLASDGTTYINS